MALDPRTPVLVGVGQVTQRPDLNVALEDRMDPIALMAAALRNAVEDCDGADGGGAAPAGNHLLQAAESLTTISMLTWRVAHPGTLVAAELGIAPSEQVLTAIGGNMPQAVLHRVAQQVASGKIDVALVVGVECGSTRAAARKAGVRLSWPEDPGDGTPAPLAFGSDRTPGTAEEVAAGVVMPIQAYPLFENAIRWASGWTLDEHRSHIGALWSRFSTVAATNPYAWLPEEKTTEEVVGATPKNRMVSFPYTKLCTANMQVDQAAGFICCSVEAARSAGVPEDRWVFPLSGSEATDHWFISERPDLHRSPAIRLAGTRALSLANVTIDDLGPIDLYSCFPCVVRIAATELGMNADDPDRPLTLTGGLTFGGGPGNNYTSHGIAALAQRLREEPGSVGMATGLGWYATKHAIGIYASRPPEHEGRDGFRCEDVQEEMDALPKATAVTGVSGRAVIETYTVTFGRDPSPERGILVCRLPDGNRTWATITDADSCVALTTSEGIGRSVSIDEAGAAVLL